MRSLITKIIVGVCTSALCGGLVLYFHLNTLAASMMGVASGNIIPLTLLLSGAGGLVGLVLWLVFGLEDRISGLASPRPSFVSLAYVSFATVVAIRVGDRNAVGLELVAIVRNTNPEAIAYSAELRAVANEVNWENANGQTLRFDGFITAGNNGSLILRMNAPIVANGDWATVAGTFDYDLTYYYSPRRRNVRTTGKTIEFQAEFRLNNAIGHRDERPVHIVFRQERET